MVRGWLKRIFRRNRRAESQAEEIVALILPKLAAEGLLDDARRTFVASRFRDRMITHLGVAPRQNLAFGMLSLVSIAGGVAVSSLATEDSDVVFWLGLVIAAATTLNQIWKFGPRAAVRFRSGNALRQEGWDYVMGRGRYKRKPPDEAWDAFYDTVWQIERASDAMVEADPESDGSG